MQQVRKFAFDVGWGLVGSLATALVSLVVRIVLGRWLGSADLGLYQVLLTIYNIGLVVCTFGVSVALTKYVAEYKDDRGKLAQTITSGMIMSALFGATLGLIMYGCAQLLSEALHLPELAGLVKTLAFVFPLAALLESTLGMLNGYRAMRTFAATLILRSFFLITFTVIPVAFGLGIAGAALGLAASVVAGWAAGLWLSRKLIHLQKENFGLAFKELIGFGMPAVGANAVNLVSNQADIIILAYYTAAADVGYYSAAVTIVGVLALMPQAIQRITFAATSDFWARRDKPGLQMMIDKSMKFSACLLLPVGLALGFFARDVMVAAFGPEFVNASVLLTILLVGRVLQGSLYSPVGACLGGIGRPDLAFWVSLFSAVAAVALNVVLASRFGTVGAAVATTTSAILGMMFFFYWFLKYAEVKIDFRRIGQAIGIGCLGVGLFWLGTRVSSPYFIGPVVVLLSIFLVLKLVLSPNDRSFIRSFIKGF